MFKEFEEKCKTDPSLIEDLSATNSSKKGTSTKKRPIRSSSKSSNNSTGRKNVNKSSEKIKSSTRQKDGFEEGYKYVVNLI